MTTDQEHIVTMLTIRYGDIRKVLTKYCALSHDLNNEEFHAVEKWIQSDAGKPYREGVMKRITYYGANA